MPETVANWYGLCSTSPLREERSERSRRTVTAGETLLEGAYVVLTARVCSRWSLRNWLSATISDEVSTLCDADANWTLIGYPRRTNLKTGPAGFWT